MTKIAVFAFTFLCGTAAQAAQGTMFVSSWPRQINVIDEGSQQVIDRIQLSTGTPRALLSDDGETIYVWTVDRNGIEVVDAATHKITNAFVLDHGTTVVRFNYWAVDQDGKTMYLLTQVIEKAIDRYKINPTRFAVLDLAQGRIVRSGDFPKDEDPGLRSGHVSGNMRLSPDGKYLYIFRNNVLVFDTSDFSLIEKIEISKLDFPGMDGGGLGQTVDSIQEPGKFVSLFNSSDPVVHREMFGIARFDLTKRTFEFTPIGPSAIGTMGLHLTPDRKVGYTVASIGAQGNRRTEFWVFDLSTNQVVRRQEFEGRSRFTFGISSSGKDLYVYGAGNTIEVYDADSLKWRTTIDIEADITGDNMIVIPSRQRE